MNQDPAVSSADLRELIEEIDKLTNSVGRVIDASGHAPVSESIAAKELESFPRPASLKAAYSQGSILIEACADQLMSFMRSITEPVLTISPWTNVRSILEASALSSWLLDPGLGVSDRVMRSYSLRLEGLIQEAKFARSLGDTQVADRVEARMEEIAADAKELGFESIHDNNGRLCGIGIRMPPTTQLIRDTLGEEATYRLLSAVVHGHSWALQQVGFQKVESDGMLYLEKSIEPVAILYLSLKAINTFFQPVKFKFDFFGWDLGDTPIIEDAIKKRITGLFDPSKYPGQAST